MKFKIITLGCKVNTYESNVVRDSFLNEGYIEVENDADIVVVNTCTVTDTADTKSLKIIRRARRENLNAIMVVMGCFSQISSHLLKDLNIEIILGNYNKSKVLDYIKEYLKNKQNINEVSNMSDKPFENMSLNNFNKTRAFVKIEDGCENFCSYCIIPYARGKVRSKKLENVISEIKSLVNNGHKEVVLTGIHTGHYGLDVDTSFPSLLNEICKIKGLERVRISSIEVTELNDEFLEALSNNKVLVDHIHIPIQSGCDKTLKEMNRKYDVDYFYNKIEKIRKIRPDISITTDVIVGFPNELEEDFNITVNNLKKINFSKLHVFPYSRRKGTKADLMNNQIDEQTKKERVKILMDLSKELEIDYFNKFIGREVTFIPEVIKDGYLIGHTGNYLLVKMKGCQNLLNQDVNVRIEKIEYPYVIGR